MNSTVREYPDRVTLEIEGREPIKDLTYPEAMAALDKAYSEELQALVEQADQCRAAAESGIVQAARAIDKLKTILRNAKQKEAEE